MLDKYLINGVDIYMKLFRSATPFMLMSSESSPNYRLKILDIAFKTARVKLDPGGIIDNRSENPLPDI